MLSTGKQCYITFPSCPIISAFNLHFSLVPAIVLVTGNKEIKSKEGTTQGDPTATWAYALG